MDFKFSCMILAGGMSLRMHGINKAFVKLGNQSLISKIINNIPHQHIKTAINANKNLNAFYKFGLETIKDDIGKNYGPLSGIYTALNWANKLKFKWVLTIPCDIPFFPKDFFLKANYLLDDKLKKFDVLSVTSNKKKHHIISIWSVDLKNNLKKEIIDGCRKVDDFASKQKIKYINYYFDKCDIDPFYNVNSETDLIKLQQRINY